MMPTKDGIRVQLKTTDGDLIMVRDGKVVIEPGQQYTVSIRVTKDFDWFGASHLYVEIATRGSSTKKASWDGDETQVLAIRKASDAAVEISEMSKWDVHEPGSPPKQTPFAMPPPHLDTQNAGSEASKLPDLQARRGCVQVLLRRGHLRENGGAYGRRAADPHKQSPEEYQKPYQHINPLWFTPLKVQGKPIVFHFENSSSETALAASEEPDLTPVAPFAMKRSPQTDRNRTHTPAKVQNRSTASLTGSPLIKNSSGQKFEDENEKRNSTKTTEGRDRVPSKREFRTPSPSPRSSDTHDPSSIGSTAPMSSQKKRELLQMQLKESRREKEEFRLERELAMLENED